MVEFKVKLDESVVQALGHKEVEARLQGFAQTMLLKKAAHDLLEHEDTIDLQNDPSWQTARHLAWEQEKHKYLK